MNTKRLLFFVIFCLFIVPITNTYADTFGGVSLYSDNRVYATPFTTPNTYSMTAAAQVQFTDVAHVVYVQLIREMVNIDYQTNLDYYSTWPNNQYAKLLLPAGDYNPPSSYPSPGNYYERRDDPTYVLAPRFYIDLNGNGIFDGSGPSPEPSRSMPPPPVGTFIQIPAVTNVQITGGIHPTVSWSPASGADLYKVLILGLDADGNPVADDLKFMTADLNSGSGSYEYTGDLFASGKSYAFAIEARDYLDYYGLVNRSRYYFKYSAVPEPTTLLLLGLGLMGLAGVRRKFKK